MYTDSIATRNTVATQVRAFAQKGRPDIQVTLNDQEGAYISTYTTKDQLQGEASITAPHDARFDEVHLTLEGTAKTFVENSAATTAAHSRSEAFHTFLKLAQPIPESAYPQPRIAEAGRTYKFPFTFVIPDQLLPSACTHRCENEQLHQAHLQLPASLGDPSVAGEGNKLLDDMAPTMSKVVYAIRVKITRHRDSDGKELILGDKTHKIRVVPAVEEQPPVNVQDDKRDYVLRKEKALRKGLFKGKLGRVTMEAAQPKSICLPPPRTASPCPSTTMAKVVLRFDPAKENVAPPRLGMLSSKLKVNTFFASQPMKEFSSCENAFFDRSRGLYTDSITLSSRCVESTKWEKHEADDVLRRDSAFSVASSSSGTFQPKPSAGYTGKTFYTANVLVPIALPKCKTFVPTFHSCLVARVYQLELALAVHTPGRTITAPTLQLRLPLQISAAANLSTVPAVTTEQEADAFFEPRSITPPSDEYLHTSAAMLSPGAEMQQIQATQPVGPPPPGYSFFAGASHGVPVRIPSPVGIAPGCG